MLLVLTSADIRAVGPGVWNAWKGQLLTDLFRQTESVLRGEEGGNRAALAPPVKTRLEDALERWEPAARERILARFPTSYWLTTAEDDLLLHAKMTREVEILERDGDLPASIRIAPSPDTGVSALTVATRDRQGLFALLAGAIAASGANVVDARLFTASDGMVIDIFMIQDLDQTPFDGEDAAERLRRSLRRALAEGIVPPAARRFRLKAREQAFHVEPQVVADNAASELCTVLEVTARDRPRLLADLAAAIRDLGLSVSSAHIATFGERAVDTFYVKDRFGLKIAHPLALRRVAQALETAAGAKADAA
jgi:[protein-PII] uridylyltransferase